MMMIKKVFVLLPGFLCVCFFLNSQTYEIRTINKGNGFIAVELRSTSGTAPATSDFVTDLTFGIKWPVNYGVNLASTISTAYNILKSDVRKTKGIYYFQAFSASNTPISFPAAWTLNNWVEVMFIRNTFNGNGTGVFDITEPGFDVTTDPNFGINLIDYTPSIGGSATNVALPIKLLYFDAVAGTKLIDLSWATSEEQNNARFDIERSMGTATRFLKIGEVYSKGSLGAKYNMEDRDVIAGITYYYRLKQIDKDGMFSYSPVKMAIAGEINGAGIRLFPNPADKLLTVVFERQPTATNLLIRILDSKGVNVLLKNYTLLAGRKVELNVSALSGGQYFLTIETNKGILYSKLFIKQ